MAAKTEWTKEQARVINHREGNLLVAAAAGSGKTAVLSERIIEMLKSREHPLDVDSFLVVTFTRAAAAEMKERIAKKLSAYVQENPDDKHMRKQLTLVNNASVTTIDSFCNQIVKEYFHIIDLDPAFRIADEGEMKLIESEVLSDMLEEKYAEGSAAYLDFSSRYATAGTDDSALEEKVLLLYGESQSNPYPLYWLEKCKESSGINSPEDIENAWFTKEIVNETQRTLKAQVKKYHELISYAESLGLEEPGVRVFEADIDRLERIAGLDSYLKIYEAINAKLYDTAKNKGLEKKDIEKVKARRELIKDAVNGLKERYYKCDPELLVGYYRENSAQTAYFCDLVKEFTRRLDARKKELGVFSFNDIEHFALYILMSEDPENPVPSVAADSLRERFDAIIVDEYQDSNLLQESILNAISRKDVKTVEHPDGNPNIFMVGDVKQSIYRFRKARPELFMEKYDSYGDSGLFSKIVLKNNFRSRKEVLEAANVTFEYCMHKDFCGIEYDRDAALHFSSTNYTDVENGIFNPELIIAKRSKEEGYENEYAYQEAYSTAEYIKKITGPDSDMLVTHGEKLEKPRYSDIVVLLRSSSSYLEPFTTVLSDEGIPVRAEVKKGFFETGEVKTTLNFLECLNNPRQDIPFATLLYSPLVRISNEELSGVVKRGQYIYDAALNYKGNERLSAFMEMFSTLKERSSVLSVTGLIDEFYNTTGFYDIVRSMPQGQRRAANLDFLREQAVALEKLGKGSLFEFICYIKNMQDQDIDYGEAGALVSDDTVRIMTIHGSKGLEFPIVIIPQIFKDFNRMDSCGELVVHPDYGPALSHVDANKRIKLKLPKKALFERSITNAGIAEELRLLYVAMTRAKEKLVLVGAAEKLSKYIPEEAFEGPLDMVDASKVKCYFDAVKGAVFSSTSLCAKLYEAAVQIDGDYDSEDVSKHTFEPFSDDIPLLSSTTHNPVTWKISVVPGHGRPIEVLQRSESLKAAEEFAKEALNGEAVKIPEETRKRIEELSGAASFVYPYEEFTKKPVKYSVSQLKYGVPENTGNEGDDYDRGKTVFEEATENEMSRSQARTGLGDEIPPSQAETGHGDETLLSQNRTGCGSETLGKTPQTGSKGSERNTVKRGKGGARYGTAMHRVLELLPFEKTMTDREVYGFIRELVSKGLMEEEEAKLADVSGIAAFTRTELYGRMCGANAEHRLYREQPFTFGINEKGGDEDDITLIQGVIDAFFADDDGVVLADYKTDRATVESIAEKYRKQLDLYEEALTAIRGFKVKEKLIYSFFNKSEIKL